MLFIEIITTTRRFMDLKIAFLLIFSAAMFVAFFCLKLLPDYQRYAMFVAGHYVGLKGPGIFMKWPSLERAWMLVSLGDIGAMDRPGVGKFAGHEYPVINVEAISVGSSIRIIGFSVDRLTVGLDSSRQT